MFSSQCCDSYKCHSRRKKHFRCFLLFRKAYFLTNILRIIPASYRQQTVPSEVVSLCCTAPCTVWCRFCLIFLSALWKKRSWGRDFFCPLSKYRMLPCLGISCSCSSVTRSSAGLDSHHTTHCLCCPFPFCLPCDADIESASEKLSSLWREIIVGK